MRITYLILTLLLLITLSNSQTCKNIRYIKLNSTRILYIAEFQAFVNGVNIAIGKKVNQSSTATGGDAAKAIDGNTNTSWSGGSISATASAPSWFILDLLAEYPVDRVTIYNRLDGSMSGLSNSLMEYISSCNEVIGSVTLPGLSGVPSWSWTVITKYNLPTTAPPPTTVAPTTRAPTTVPATESTENFQGNVPYGKVVSIFSVNGTTMRAVFPQECLTASDINEVKAYCTKYAVNANTCLQEFCDMTRSSPDVMGKVMRTSFVDCQNDFQFSQTDRNFFCRKYRLAWRFKSLSTYLATRLIKFFGTKTPSTGSSWFIIPWILYTKANSPGDFNFQEVSFYAPDFGDIYDVQIMSATNREGDKYSNLVLRYGAALDIEYLRLIQSTREYIMGFNRGESFPELTILKPLTLTKQWFHYDLIDTRPICFGRGICPWLGDYQYSTTVSSYQERFRQTEANAARSDAKEFLIWQGIDPTKLACYQNDTRSPQPYYYASRTQQGANFKSYESGNIEGGHMSTVLCYLYDIKSNLTTCGFMDRMGITGIEPCHTDHFECRTPTNRHPYKRKYRGLPWPYSSSWKAEGIGSPGSLITSDPGHCGGILSHERAVAAFGWFPSTRNLDVKVSYLNYTNGKVLGGSTTGDYAWYLPGQAHPANLDVLNTYQPIPSGSHYSTLFDGKIRFYAQHYASDYSTLKEFNVYINNVKYSMILRIGNSTWGTYYYDFTPPVTINVCYKYYFEVIQNGKTESYTFPASKAYVFATYGLFGCLDHHQEDLCVGVNCGVNGVCNQNDGKCTCKTGFHGNLCQNPDTIAKCTNVKCGNYGFCDTIRGNCVCKGDFLKHDCSLSVGYLGGGDHGELDNLDFETKWAAKFGNTNFPYYSKYPKKTLFTCFTKSSSAKDVCSGNGQCIGTDVCSCYKGYVGNQCQYPVCNGKAASDLTVCSGKGQCLLPDKCKCTWQYGGNNCQTKMCEGLGVRYVRIIRRKPHTVLQLSEVQVFSKGLNIALQRYTRSSSFEVGFEASKANNGRATGQTDDAFMSQSTGEGNPWWEVDFGSEYPTIEKIVITNRMYGDRINYSDVELHDGCRRVLEVQNLGDMTSVPEKTIIPKIVKNTLDIDEEDDTLSYD